MAEQQSNKERLKEITDRIEAGIQEMFQSGNVQKYEAYLRTMGRFHRYSVNNVMLILMQRPDATLVAGYNKWQNQFGRHVMRGEKGITIIAPTPYKKKIEEEKLDPNTQKPMLDENGDVIMEEKEIRIPMFRPTTVFDVAQTEGKPLPERVANPVATLTGDVENYEVFMEALRRSSPVPIRAGEMDADTDGYFSRTDQEIVYREGMSQIQTVSAVIHEIGHAKLHNYGVQQAQTAAEAGTELPKAKDRNTEEVEAESISCAVCAFSGLIRVQTASATLLPGQKIRSCRSSGQVWIPSAGQRTALSRMWKPILLKSAKSAGLTFPRKRKRTLCRNRRNLHQKMMRSR